MPDMHRLQDDPMLSINEEKTIILTEKFFPQTGNADLLDVINHPGGARP